MLSRGALLHDLTVKLRSVLPTVTWCAVLQHTAAGKGCESPPPACKMVLAHFLSSSEFYSSRASPASYVVLSGMQFMGEFEGMLTRT
jgi:hypothetical protein